MKPKPIGWTFAKTYRDAPHEYIIQDQEPEVYAWYKERLEKEGVREQFTHRGRTATYRYCGGDGYKYWVIGRTLNRAKADLFREMAFLP